MQIEATRQFKDWLDELKDLSGRARIQARIRRLADGNLGQHRVLTGGVCEMKVDVGLGYRVYYTQRGTTLVLLLVGGDKHSQDKDIKQALALANTL